LTGGYDFVFIDGREVVKGKVQRKMEKERERERERKRKRKRKRERVKCKVLMANCKGQLRFT